MPSKNPEVGRRAVRKYRERLQGTQTQQERRQKDWKKIKADPAKKAKRDAAKAQRHAERMQTDPAYREEIAASSERGRVRLREKPEQERIQLTRKWRLKSDYDLTPEQYEKMLADQDRRCAICGATEAGGRRRHLCVDHDHATNKIRGLLCVMCNLGLGKFRDDPTLLRQAALYLEALGQAPEGSLISEE